MPIFILAVGIMLVIVGVNNKLFEMNTLLKDAFTAKGNSPPFQVWILAIFVAGSLGYIKSMRPVANAFLILIIVSLLLSNQGFFKQFKSALEGK